MNSQIGLGVIVFLLIVLLILYFISKSAEPECQSVNRDRFAALADDSLMVPDELKADPAFIAGIFETKNKQDIIDSFCSLEKQGFSLSEIEHHADVQKRQYANSYRLAYALYQNRPEDEIKALLVIDQKVTDDIAELMTQSAIKGYTATAGTKVPLTQEGKDKFRQGFRTMLEAVDRVAMMKEKVEAYRTK